MSDTLRKAPSELTLRVVSAVAMAAVAIATDWFGGWSFALLWSLVALLVLGEWLRIVGGGNPKAPFGRWQLLGAGYALALLWSMMALRDVQAGSGGDGFVAILFLFAIVWGTDVGAYFAGRTFGGPKLAPRISPKKTWSGAVGGLFVGMGAALGLLAVVGKPLGLWQVGIAAALSVATILGDLFESALKRRFDVKDASQLIPGHGGLMDRVDGLVAAALLAALIGLSAGGQGIARGLLGS